MAHASVITQSWSVGFFLDSKILWYIAKSSTIHSSGVRSNLDNDLVGWVTSSFLTAWSLFLLYLVNIICLKSDQDPRSPLCTPSCQRCTWASTELKLFRMHLTEVSTHLHLKPALAAPRSRKIENKVEIILARFLSCQFCQQRAQK